MINQHERIRSLVNTADRERLETQVRIEIAKSNWSMARKHLDELIIMRELQIPKSKRLQTTSPIVKDLVYYYKTLCYCYLMMDKPGKSAEMKVELINLLRGMEQAWIKYARGHSLFRRYYRNFTRHSATKDNWSVFALWTIGVLVCGGVVTLYALENEKINHYTYGFGVFMPVVAVAYCLLATCGSSVYCCCSSSTASNALKMGRLVTTIENFDPANAYGSADVKVAVNEEYRHVRSGSGSDSDDGLTTTVRFA